jgi:hypothetical protein
MVARQRLRTVGMTVEEYTCSRSIDAAACRVVVQSAYTTA